MYNDLMISQIALTQFLGKPLIMYGGILTLLLLLFTASIAIMMKKRIKYVPFKYHPIMARITIAVALIHALLGLSIYFHF